MKEKYIKQVKKRLAVPSSKRKTVLQDLEKTFASAAENGETEQQVISRLGTPEQFAAGIEEQLGVNRQKLLKTRTVVWTIIWLVVAVVGFLVYLTIRQQQELNGALGIIGGADGPTAIIVSGPGIDVPLVMLMIAAAAVVLAVIGIVRYLLKNAKK